MRRGSGNNSGAARRGRSTPGVAPPIAQRAYAHRSADLGAHGRPPDIDHVVNKQLRECGTVLSIALLDGYLQECVTRCVSPAAVPRRRVPLPEAVVTSTVTDARSELR